MSKNRNNLSSTKVKSYKSYAIVLLSKDKHETKTANNS